MNQNLYEARDGLNKSKIDAAMETNAENRHDYRGNFTARENGSLVKKMVEEYELNLLGK